MNDRLSTVKTTKAANSLGSVEQLNEQQAAAVKAFIQQVGGIENARRAIAALKELKKAA